MDKYKLPQISTGDMLREAVAAGSALGRQAKVAMDAGQLVSDDIVLGIIQERVTRPDTRNGFILDGFPRNLQQAEALDQLLTGLGRPLNLALLIAVDVDALIQRLVGRRTCLSCGQMYNVFYAPPHIEGRCDACGGRLRHRGDDNEETIGNRLRVYETHTQPVIEYYQQQEKLRTVQGVGEIADIFKAIVRIVDEMKPSTRTETPYRYHSCRLCEAQGDRQEASRNRRGEEKGRQTGRDEETGSTGAAAKKKTATAQSRLARRKRPRQRKEGAAKKKAAPKRRSRQRRRLPPKRRSRPKNPPERPLPVDRPPKRTVVKKKPAIKKKVAAKKPAREKGGCKEEIGRQKTLVTIADAAVCRNIAC